MLLTCLSFLSILGTFDIVKGGSECGGGGGGVDRAEGKMTRWRWRRGGGREEVVKERV